MQGPAGRGFDSSEGILFCPFCGTAYQDSAPAQQETTTRIVIGSDSERTVQEKYWELTRGEIFRAEDRLERQNP